MKTYNNIMAFFAFSIILFLFKVYSGIGEVYFNYHKLIDKQDFILNINYFLVIALGLMSGGTVGKFFVQKYSFVLRSRMKTRIRSASSLIHWLVFLYVAIILINADFTFVREDMYANRVFENKFSWFLLAIYSTALLSSKPSFMKLMNLAFFSFAICIFDGSRVGLVPSAVLLLLGRNSISNRILLILILVVGFSMLIYARNNYEPVDYMTVISVMPTFVSYFTDFSIFHFLYVLDQPHNFTLHDAFVSVLPIPSSLIPFQYNTEDWRLDGARPLGAQAAVASISLNLLFVLNLFIGICARLIEKSRKNLTSDIAGFLIFFAFCISFQYSLRPVALLLYVSLFLSFLGQFQIRKV